ncbi:MAG: glycine--tRNA ligase [Phycisphaerales bacterium]|nr:glycine--tRNA ligase [Phycisphaerales bacterium]
MAKPPPSAVDNVVSLAKRRGFVYPCGEIYGGTRSAWDYGPLGAMLKKNLRDAWWDDIVMLPCWGRKGPDGDKVSIVPLDTCIIQNPKVWVASGHVGGFNDPMVDDKETKQRFRADHLQGFYAGTKEDFAAMDAADEAVERGLAKFNVRPVATLIANSPSEALELMQRDPKLIKPFKIVRVYQTSSAGPGTISVKVEERGHASIGIIKAVEMSMLVNEPESVLSPFSGKAGALTAPRQFNLMFYSYTGAVHDEATKVYLRPETAQGIFINFKNVVDTSRVRIPFGIAQTGKAFRNEVTPRNFTFRSREFEQMEIEFFCHESDAMAWYTFWRDFRMEWWKSIGLAGDNLILREHDTDELAHYSKATSDIEYRFPFTAPGYGELEGVAYRGAFDLTQHTEHSKVKLDYFDTERGPINPKTNLPAGERYTPHVIEPSAGLDRGVLAILCEAYTPDTTRASGVFMKFHPRVAPIKAAVFPLVNKDGLPELADRLHADLVKRFGRYGLIETDAKQSIGKRYARMDEAGCPFCFTIDGQTREDGTVTVRHRDDQRQERMPLEDVVVFLERALQL